MAAIDPNILNPDKTGELEEQFDFEGPDRPGTGGRYDARRLEQARWYYADDPNISIAGAFEKAGLPKELAYRMRMDGRWNKWEFNEQRATVTALKLGKDAEKSVRRYAERLRRNEMASAKIGEAVEAVDPQSKDAPDQLGKLANAESRNTQTLMLLLDKPTSRVETSTPDDKLSPDDRLARAEALTELLRKKIQERDRGSA